MYNVIVLTTTSSHNVYVYMCNVFVSVYNVQCALHYEHRIPRLTACRCGTLTTTTHETCSNIFHLIYVIIGIAPVCLFM